LDLLFRKIYRKPLDTRGFKYGGSWQFFNSSSNSVRIPSDFPSSRTLHGHDGGKSAITSWNLLKVPHLSLVRDGGHKFWKFSSSHWAYHRDSSQGYDLNN
jgi:hypothetical protein